MKIVTENILIKVSKLVKDNAGDESSFVDVDQIDALVSEIAGPGLVVEVASLGFEEA